MNGSNSFGSLPTNSTSAANFGVSLATVLLAQLALALLPRCFPYTHLLVQLLLAAAVLLGFFGVGGRLRRLLGLRASAPAFVFFSIVYVWAVYFGFARKAVSVAVDVMFHLEVALLIVGLCRILRKDPGRIAPDESYLNELDDGSFSSPETEDRPQVNWEKYPEFQLVIDPVQDPDPSNPRFTNPYNKGIMENIKQFLWQGGSVTRLL